jgi:hypothetical protein
MNHKERFTSRLASLAAVCVLSTCGSVSTTFAGSVTQPGETVGIATGIPLPQGVYFVDTFDWGIRTTIPSTGVGVNIPVVAWSTPWTILGGRVQFLVATPELEAGVSGVPIAPATSPLYSYSWYNPWTFGQIAWDLGNGFGFSYGIGAYWAVDQALAWDSTSLNQRFGFAYVKNNWAVAANVIYGIEFNQFNFAPSSLGSGYCPVAGFACNADFVNLDVSVTHKFGKWEVGPVAYASWDVSTPVAGYGRQSQLAVGALVGYDFGPVALQVYATRTVVEDNYNYYDSRFWARLIIPVWTPPAESPLPVKGPYR